MSEDTLLYCQILLYPVHPGMRQNLELQKLVVFPAHARVQCQVHDSCHAKISLEKYASSPEILVKMSQNTQVWFGDLDIGKSSSNVGKSQFLHKQTSG